jgi:hypothetical protein
MQNPSGGEMAGQGVNYMVQYSAEPERQYRGNPFDRHALDERGSVSKTLDAHAWSGAPHAHAEENHTIGQSWSDSIDRFSAEYFFGGHRV